MPTAQQKQAMDYVKNQIAADKGADLNANTNPFGPNAPNPQPLNSNVPNPTQAPLTGASNNSQTLSNPQQVDVKTPPTQQPNQNPNFGMMTQSAQQDYLQKTGQQMDQFNGQQSQQKSAQPPMQQSQQQTQQIPQNQPPQQPAQPQQQGQQNQSQPQQQVNQPSDNSNTQIPQGGNVHQTSAGNFVPQTTGDDGMISALNQKTGQMEQASPNDPRWATGGLVQNNPSYQMGNSTPASNVLGALQGMQGQGFDSMMQNAQTQGVDATGAHLLKQSLMSQLGAIDDPNIAKYLDNMANRAQSSYSIGLNMVNKGREELDQAIQGTLVSPSTFEGTQAKVLKDTEDLQLQTIAAQRQYQQDQNNIQLDAIQTKRADLEGFLKAKMYADGTQGSSAALSVMSQSLHQTDMTIAATNSGYTYAQAQLNIQGMQVMHDFGNNISQLVSQTNQKQQQITSDYYGQLNQIDTQALANEKEKRTATSAAFGSYYKGMSDLRTAQQTREMDYAKFAWEQHQGIVQNSIAMAGVSGTIWTPDGKGGFQDTGVQTMAGRQNQFTQWHDTATLQLQTAAQNRDTAFSEIDKAIANGYTPGTQAFGDFKHGLEQMMGATQGSFSGINTIDGLKSSVAAMGDTAQKQQQQIAQTTNLQNVPQGIKDVFKVGQNVGIQCGYYSDSISTNRNGPNSVGMTWADKLNTIRKNGTLQDNPEPGFKVLLPLGVNTDGKGAGHVETVVSFDPNTRNMMIVDSNRVGKNTVGTKIVNLDDMNKQYGDKWGFVPADFKPAIQQQLAQLGPQSFQQQTPPQPNVDYFAKALQESGQGLTQDELVRKVANYEIDPAKISSYTKVPPTTITAKALQLNPKYNDAKYTANADYLKSWESGQQGTPGYTNATANTAVKHLGILYDAFQKMSNSGIKDWNGAIQYAAQHGDDPALAAFYTSVDPVAGEIGKAMTGGVPGETEMADLKKRLDSAQGPQAMESTIKTYMGLMAGKISTSVNQYKSNMGNLPSQVLDDEAARVIKQMGLKPEDYDPSYKESDTNQQNQSQPDKFTGGGQNNNFKIPAETLKSSKGYNMISPIQASLNLNQYY